MFLGKRTQILDVFFKTGSFSNTWQSLVQFCSVKSEDIVFKKEQRQNIMTFHTYA